MMTTYAPISRTGVDASDSLTFPEKRITLSTTITYRGRQITVAAEGYSLDQFVEMLDKRAPAGRTEVHAAPHDPADGTPMCQNRNCSRYGKLLVPSQHGTGVYCQGKDTTSGSTKGYCKSVG